MAIIDWREIHQERTGELDQVRAVRHYQRCFRLITDDTLDGPETILLNSEFLGLLTIYIEANGVVDPGAILRNVRCHQPEGDNPNVWILTYEYSSEPLDPQQRGVSEPSGGTGGGGGGNDNSPPGQGVQDPLDRPPIFTLDVSKFQRVLNVDALGAAVTNSAGTPFSPQPEVDDSRFVLTMERNEVEPDWGVLLNYQDAINIDEFMGFAPGTAKVTIKAQSMFENNVYYWKVTYTFEFRAYVNIQGVLYSAWDSHLVDQGWDVLDANGNKNRYIDDRGIPTSEPVNLDGRGNVAKGGVTAIKIVNGGSGYAGQVPLEFSGGGGSGAAGYAIGTGVGNAEGGPLLGAVVTNPGSGYTSAPTVTTAGGLGVGAVLEATVGIGTYFVHYRGYKWQPFSVFELPPSIN